MNWDALAAVAEMLGALGVIATLLYLSRQIQHNSRQLAGTSTVAVHEYRRSMTEELAANPELWAAVKKSNLNWDDLTEEEQANAALWNIKEASYWEMCYRLHKQGALDTSVYEAAEKYYLKLYQAPGRRRWWQDNPVVLADDFYSEMSAKLDAATSETTDFATDHPYWVKE